MPRISQGFWKFLVYVWETDALVLKSEAFMPFLSFILLFPTILLRNILI